MKKTRFIYAALFAMTLSCGLISCDNDNDDDVIVLDPTIKTTVVDDALAQESEDLSNVADSHELYTIEFKDAECPVKEIVLVNDKEALVYINSVPTRSIISNILLCTYRFEGTKIIIETKSELGNITFDITNPLEVTINETPYEAKTEVIEEPKTAEEVSLCRKWYNPKYTAGIYVDKLPIYGANDNEKTPVSDIRVLKNAILSKLTEDNPYKDEGFKFLNNNITSVNFLTNGTVYITYSDNSVEESSWGWINQANGRLTTTLDGKKVDIDVRFEAGTPNIATFIIDANLNGITGLGVHTLSGRLVCTMND